MRTFWRYPVALTLVAAGCGGGDPGAGADAGPGGDDPCAIQAAVEPQAGFPDGYDLASFESDLLPQLEASCGSAACHNAEAASGGYAILTPYARSGSEDETCNFNKNFNNFREFTDDNVAKNSRLYSALDGTFETHPVSTAAGSVDQALVDSIVSFIENAHELAGSGGNFVCGNDPLDCDTFENTIMPMIDTVGCTNQGCHDDQTATLGFGMFPNAEPGSDQMKQNFETVRGRVDFEDPARSQVYIRATTTHAGGASQTLEAADAETMLAWIQAGADAAGDGGNNTGCADISGFNTAVFADEIMPILNGDRDLNEDGQAGSGPLCTNGPCHGTDRGPGSLYLDANRDAIANLESFSCFVNFQNPVRSEILLCPLDRSGCRLDHPGSDVFEDTNDLNYQRLLSYIYSGNPNASPFDFAFYAKKINPIYNNPEASQDGRTCDEGGSCHGVNVAGDPPPNASNFPILRGAGGDVQALTVNFTNSAAFASFLNGEESSLFLYPTNEIQNVLGISHLGGEAFAADDQFALDIIEWVEGLRPDGQGFNPHWLVAGDYNADDVDVEFAGVDEPTITPSIFDDSFASGVNNGGIWDGFFSDVADIELNDVFTRDQSPGRVGYAVAYVINTDSQDLRVTLTVDSANDTKIYFGSQGPGLGQGNAVSLTETVPAFTGEDGDLKRILIKVFQPAGEADGFDFTAQFTDEDGDPLTDDTGELVIVLGPEGGI